MEQMFSMGASKLATTIFRPVMQNASLTNIGGASDGNDCQYLPLWEVITGQAHSRHVERKVSAMRRLAGG
jgi:hypothetical protein